MLNSSHFLKDWLILFAEDLGENSSLGNTAGAGLWRDHLAEDPKQHHLRLPLSSCLIKHSTAHTHTYTATSEGKWRSYLKLLGASDKHNVIIWTEIQLASLTTAARGSLRIRCSIWSQSLALETLEWREHPTPGHQQHLIWLPTPASTTWPGR